jgi:hypothetical protein
VTPATVAFHLHAGRTVTVILTGRRSTPEMAMRHEIDLADPWVRSSRHPYHHLGSPADEKEWNRGCAAARKSAHRAIATFLREMRAHKYEPVGAAVVVANRTQPQTPHAVAHEEEENLYRAAIEAAVRDAGVEVTTFVDTQVRTHGTKRLGRSVPIDATLKRLSHAVGTPWRAQEKQAALAAWILLPR